MSIRGTYISVATFPSEFLYTTPEIWIYCEKYFSIQFKQRLKIETLGRREVSFVLRNGICKISERIATKVLKSRLSTCLFQGKYEFKGMHPVLPLIGGDSGVV